MGRLFLNGLCNMKKVMMGLAIASTAFFLSACSGNSGGNFIGTWEGETPTGYGLEYKIEKGDEMLTVTRIFKKWSSERKYKAEVRDDITLILNDGDILMYQEDSGTIYARGDDAELTKVK